MTKPFWRRVDVVCVKAAPDEGFWTMALDWVSGPRLLKFSVSDKDAKGKTVVTKWTLVTGKECSANGDASASVAAAICDGANMGALVGKIGGSAADRPGVALPPTTPVSYPGRKIFAAGALCTIRLDKDDGGPLFLTMNDEPGHFADHTGELHILIDEAGG